ncbi:MAG: HD domain-containing protein [Patescibacteria group bacterium]
MIKKIQKLNYTEICRDALKIMLSIKDGAHNVEHVVRVYDFSRELAKNYPEVDLNVLKVAAYWHDVGRKYESKETDDHNIKSGEQVEKYLLEKKASKDFISKVKEAVVNHGFKYVSKSIEGKIIHDADKLAFFSDHAIPDSYESMKEGYETETFNREKVVIWLKDILNHKDYFYKGLLLKESKEYYKSIEKNLEKILEKVIGANK